MFLYLFGLPAAGKNYVGQVLADEFGYTFYDGDLDLTDELRHAVRDGRPFTDPMRDRFYTALVERIAALREQEEIDAIRPDLDGRQVMDHLGVGPGPHVGQALTHLLELRLEEGPMDVDEARRRLDAWWAARS